MKSKWTKYLLVTGVIFIWSIIIYRIIHASGENKGKNPFSIQDNYPELPKNTTQKDSFLLFLNYPDPFLKKNNKTSINNHSFPRKQKEITYVNPTPDPDFIKYIGSVTDATGKHAVALININGKDTIVKKGDSVYFICIKKINKDSLKIFHNKHSYWIKHE